MITSNWKSLRLKVSVDYLQWVIITITWFQLPFAWAQMLISNHQTLVIW